MNVKKISVALATTAAAAMFVLGGASLASADPGATPSASASAQGKRAPGTPVTGDEAAKVTAAVTAKDAGVAVTSVRKEADGSYDVFGTKDGARVKFDVSADLATVTQGTARPPRDGARPDAASTTAAN